MVYTEKNWFEFPRDQIASAPVLDAEGDDLTRCLEPIEGEPLKFRTVGSDSPVTLVPYHELLGQHYVVYWRVFRQQSPEHARSRSA